MSDRITIEQAILRNEVWALMRNGRYWLVRQNGKTKTWKTRPSEFRIPIKVGLRSFGYITDKSEIGLANPQDKPDFVITSTNPNDLT